MADGLLDGPSGLEALGRAWRAPPPNPSRSEEDASRYRPGDAVFDGSHARAPREESSAPRPAAGRDASAGLMSAATERPSRFEPPLDATTTAAAAAASCRVELDLGAGLPLSKIMVGCSGLAGLFDPLSEADAAATVALALSRGLTMFDTAPHYGLGLSEERVGRALRAAASANASASRVRVWTKAGRIVYEERGSLPPGAQVEETNVLGHAGCIFPLTPPGRVAVVDYSGAGVRASLEGSRRRLGVDGSAAGGAGGAAAFTLHGLRLHDVEDEARISAALAVPGGGVSGLLDLVGSAGGAGGLREASLGMNDVESILRVLEGHPRSAELGSVMMAGRWNLLDQSGAKVLAWCQVRRAASAYACHQRLLLFFMCAYVCVYAFTWDILIRPFAMFAFFSSWRPPARACFGFIQAHGVAVHVAGVFASGLLAGGGTVEYRPANLAEQARAGAWAGLAAEFGLSLGAVALAFAALPACVTAVCVGVKSPAELAHALDDAADCPAPPALWARATRLGLLPPGLIHSDNASGSGGGAGDRGVELELAQSTRDRGGAGER